MKQLFAAILLLPGLALAGPEINIGALHDYFEGDKSTLLKRVRNSGDTTAFVKVSVSELVYDTAGAPREVPMDGLPADQRALVASPARLIVPAGGLQSVRLLYRGERERERYFRLRFIPVLPEVGDGFAVTEAQAEQYEKALKAGVNILAGYGSLAFVKPAATRYDTQVQQHSERFVVANKGNATVVLDHFSNCDLSGKSCETATVHHLLPGTERAFEKRSGRSYRFDLLESKASRTYEFNG